MRAADRPLVLVFASGSGSGGDFRFCRDLGLGGRFGFGFWRDLGLGGGFRFGGWRVLRFGSRGDYGFGSGAASGSGVASGSASGAVAGSTFGCFLDGGRCFDLCGRCNSRSGLRFDSVTVGDLPSW